MIESIQLAIAKICLWSAALLLSALAGWKAFKSLAWTLCLSGSVPPAYSTYIGHTSEKEGESE